MSPSRPSPPEAGFTIIEILVVIVVISVLATLVAPNVFRHVGTARGATARSQIEMLGAALDAHRLDVGRYPTTAEGLAILRDAPSDPTLATRWQGPYLRKALPLDPWGGPYVYRSPGEENPLGYDLVSYGSDREAGGEGDAADITSWE